MEKYTVTYNGQEIRFELYRKNVKNINLNTRPDMTVMVSANDKVPVEYIKDFVKKKAPWILKNLSYFSDAQPENKSQKEFISGESYKYLGKQIRLRVETSEKEEVKLDKGFIYLYVRNKENYTRKKSLMDKWFREKAEMAFRESLDRVLPLVQIHGINRPKIMIRVMKARWGSCVKDKGVILLNAELIKAPKYCIDYVVLHELLHFKHRTHDKQFYNFMTALMADWKDRKIILDEEVIRSL